jgi:hypothetical protein
LETDGEVLAPIDGKLDKGPISELAKEIARRALKSRNDEGLDTLSAAQTRTDPLGSGRSSRKRRASLGWSRALIAVAIGIAVTLSWQSYGDTAKQIIAGFAQEQLGWPISLSASSAPAVGEQPNLPPVPPSGSPATLPKNSPDSLRASDLQQLQSIAQELASVRGGLERLSAGQEEMARNVARLEAAEQELRDRIMTLLAKPVAAPARNPVRSAGPQPPPAQRVSPLSVAPAAAASPALASGSRR